MQGYMNYIIWQTAYRIVCHVYILLVVLYKVENVAINLERNMYRNLFKEYLIKSMVF